MRFSCRATLWMLIIAVATADAQSLGEVDSQLGFKNHQAIASTNTFVTEGIAVQNLRAIFANMASTSVVQNYSGPAGQTLYFINSGIINAYSTGGGKLYVTTGLYQAVEGNPGILAFVMGHELVHNLAQHRAKRYIREVQFQYAYRNLYTNNGALAASIFAVAQRTILNKLERDEEHEADQVGLRLAAEAGYHPDYAILAARRMRQEVGEQGKFSAFFSTHPRWTTREERSETNYDAALSAFEAKWPDVSKSPGGRPPAVASISAMKVTRSGKKTTVSFTTRVRNLDVPAALQVQVVGEKVADPIQIASAPIEGNDRQRKSFWFDVDQRTLKTRKGKQFATLAIRYGNETLACSQAVRLK